MLLPDLTGGTAIGLPAMLFSAWLFVPGSGGGPVVTTAASAAGDARILISADDLPGPGQQLRWMDDDHVVVLTMQPFTLIRMSISTGLRDDWCSEGPDPRELDPVFNRLSVVDSGLLVFQPGRNRVMRWSAEGRCELLQADDHVSATDPSMRWMVVPSLGAVAGETEAHLELYAIQDDPGPPHRLGKGLRLAGLSFEGSKSDRALGAYLTAIFAHPAGGWLVVGLGTQPWARRLHAEDDENGAPTGLRVSPLPLNAVDEWCAITALRDGHFAVLERNPQTREIHVAERDADLHLLSRSADYGPAVTGAVSPDGLHLALVRPRWGDVVVFERSD